MKIVTAAEMRQIDRTTSERFGIPSLTLMENAGAAVAEFVLSHHSAAKCIGVICGKGNNGGDGFVAARKLHEAGRQVQILLLAEASELRGDAAEMFRKLPHTAVVVRSAEELAQEPARGVFNSDVLIDAMLGTGFKPPVSGLYAQAIELINASEVPVIAVDIPSGADADVMGEQTGAVARADGIVTFTGPRPAHIFGSLTRGPIRICPIGSPDEAIVSALQLNLITPQEIARLLQPRPAAANKGNYGHVLVIGGSVGKAGAAAMAGISALRVGAGLSTVATPRSVLATVAGFHPEIMTEPLDETADGTVSQRALSRLHELSKGKTVLAVGPGISRNPETGECVRKLIRDHETLTVLDADGLNAFEGLARELNRKKNALVITPHPGEMARLTGMTVSTIQRDRTNVARSFSRDHNLVTVLKGHRTLIAEPGGEVFVNTTGNPGMATGGTGDILTGMTAGFLAQNPDHVIEAVTAAVYLHGAAGDVARDRMGEQSLVATDLIAAFPEAFRNIAEAAKRPYVEIHGA
jgi:ADP-dependent NAD(P)H-hydrate dehydratase / NAD(P)H-hydrate epimerase